MSIRWKHTASGLSRAALALFLLCALTPGLAQEACTDNPQPINNQLADFGDAPDNLPAGYAVPNDSVVGKFPTDLNTRNSRYGLKGGHTLKGSASLGSQVSLEANARDCATDPDRIPNLIDNDFDDGLQGNLCPQPVGGPFGNPVLVSLDLQVDLDPGASAGPWYVNVLFDQNQDGVWDDSSSQLAEWVIQDDLLGGLTPGGSHQITVGPFEVPANSGGNWMRVALTNAPINSVVPVNNTGWDGSGGFSDGEIEDYFISHSLSAVLAAEAAVASANASAAAVAAASAQAAAQAGAIAASCSAASASAGAASASAAAAAASASAAASSSASASAAAESAAQACASADAAAGAIAGACASCGCATACSFSGAAAAASVEACSSTSASASVSADAAASASASANAIAVALAGASANASASASACAAASASAQAAASALATASAQAQASADAAAIALSQATASACIGDSATLASALADANASAQAAASAAAAAYADAQAAAAAAASASSAASAAASAQGFAAAGAGAGASAASSASGSASASASAAAAAEATASSMSAALAAAQAGCSGSCTAEICCAVEVGARSSISVSQLALFALRSKYGDDYIPPEAEGQFYDLPRNHWAAPWVEQLFRERLIEPCGAGRICPDRNITRGEVAETLLRANLGEDFVPPDAIGMFTDVPREEPLAAWIESYVAHTGDEGCGDGRFCADEPINGVRLSDSVNVLTNADACSLSSQPTECAVVISP